VPNATTAEIMKTGRSSPRGSSIVFMHLRFSTDFDVKKLTEKFDFSTAIFRGEESSKCTALRVCTRNDRF
jgi:hypothetical protein